MIALRTGLQRPGTGVFPRRDRRPVGTCVYARELILRQSKVTVRKTRPTISEPENRGSDGHRSPTPHSRTDSKLATLYQDTLEAPIPHDMLRLLEKIGAEADEDR